MHKTAVFKFYCRFCFLGYLAIKDHFLLIPLVIL